MNLSVLDYLSDVRVRVEQTRTDINNIITNSVQVQNSNNSSQTPKDDSPITTIIQPSILHETPQKQAQVYIDYEKCVFISYAWGSASEKIVNELEKIFTENGIQIVRDKKDLSYKGSIAAFEKRIAQGQCIILVVSDKYLRSEHCMYELVEANRNQNIRARIFPIVLADARIYKAIDRLTYINHWEKQIEQLNSGIKRVKVMTKLTRISADLDKYADIRDSFDHLSDLLKDMNALTPQIHAASGFSTLISAIEKAMPSQTRIQ